ncbi:AAA family ATPase [Lentzea sp. BCCO 10_0061]|uniref:AAA family ATPase n=1 Tax=Lentzea sokolovensis TaxID=3095429 RepID=A0ABU4VA12_9PSEU|nr:AAA family ATPase [Lentzea sp. BCCO 10_0061]MDX8148626.1 AAA family ATPase [Lentzea sp. BCCO 10_0061]
MPRLIHLNGPTGVGKSTLAARYAAAHPKTLNLDADEIVRLVGGWREDFYGAVELVRPLALTMASTHLASGNDVVMPQLIMRHSERDRFAAAATSAGADYLEFVLLTPPETAISRYRHREHHIDHVVDALGGVTVIEQSHARITAYLTDKTTVIDATGNADQTYATVIEALTEQLN